MKSRILLRVPNQVRFGFSVLSISAKKKLLLSGFSLCLLGVLDLIGVGFVAIIATVTLNAVNNKPIPDKLGKYLQIFHINQNSIYKTVFILTSVMVILFTVRSLISIYLTTKIFKFLAHQSNVLTNTFLARLLNQDLISLRKYTSQEILFGSTTGLNASVVGLNGLIITTGADIFLSFIMIIAVVIYSPIIAICSILIFSLVSILLYSLLNTRIRSISQKSTQANIDSNMKILEVLDTYRESVVRNTRKNYISKITELRSEISESIAAQAILPNISKYAMELTVILGAVGVAAIQFILFDANQAIAGLSLFVAVGSRISPAFLRIQQNILSFRLNQTWADVTIRIFDQLPNEKNDHEQSSKTLEHALFNPEIEMENVSFKYEQNNDFSINNVNLKIAAGTFVAVVGSSGSGKTTFIDLLLGILNPDTGTIRISGDAPSTVHSKWPGLIAYVPQDVVIINDTLFENIALGFPYSSINEAKIIDCLRLAHLEKVVNDLPLKLYEKLGEKGSRLSGGQRQRVGIARALYTSPKILVLDEATSSLDSESEQEINNSIKELKGKLTLIVIAHRLPSVINADLVVYIENGKIAATGTFEEVRNKSKTFNTQATLMGL